MRLKGMPGRLRGEIAWCRSTAWSYGEVGKFWDTVHDYDEIDHETYSYGRRFTDSFAMRGEAVGGLVLDLCCRTGNGAIYFHERGRVGKAVCADVSGTFLEIARRKLDAAGVPSLPLLFDRLPLPFKDGRFDSVLCFETVEHVPDPERLIGELARVCRPGGTVIVTTPTLAWGPVHFMAAVFDIHHSEGPRRFLGRRELLGAIRRAGLEILDEKTTVLVPNGPKPLLRLGEVMERIFPEWVRRHIALRRIIICKRSR